ncbi:MAG: fumarylacetoacetate hydrolase family protein [Salinisphaera sp.]|nr:fumarylacetoacetate hydrolase family protein [Salinisphaera sp.]
MRLASYRFDEAPSRPALVDGDRVFDITARLAQAPADMIGLLTRLPEFRSELERLADGPDDGRLDNHRLTCPVPRPGKILALGLNYRDHIEEAGMDEPAHQTWFAKMPTAANGPYDPVHLPRVSDKLDYEAELAVVIGKLARHVPRADAADYIAGYCVGNDVSVRDWQLRTSQFVVGKSFDTHCPFGPWLVTGDELGDPQALGIRCTVNGELRQQSNTRAMVFTVFEMIEHLSQAMTLEPGDVLFTGTPAGVGAMRKPPAYLTAGDVLRTEIDGIGALENEIVHEPE